MKRILISLITLIVLPTTQADNSYLVKIEDLKSKNEVFKENLKTSYEYDDYRNNICEIISNYTNQVMVSIQYLAQPEAQKNFEEVKQELVKIQLDNKERNIDCYHH